MKRARNNFNTMLIIAALMTISGCVSNGDEKVRIVKEKEYITVNKYMHYEIPEELLKVTPSPKMPKGGIKTEEDLLDYLYKLKEHSMFSEEKLLLIGDFVKSADAENSKD